MVGCMSFSCGEKKQNIFGVPRLVIVLVVGGAQEGGRRRRRGRERVCNKHVCHCFEKNKTKNGGLYTIHKMQTRRPVIIVRRYPFQGFRDSEIIYATYEMALLRLCRTYTTSAFDMPHWFYGRSTYSSAAVAHSLKTTTRMLPISGLIGYWQLVRSRIPMPDTTPRWR